MGESMTLAVIPARLPGRDSARLGTDWRLATSGALAGRDRAGVSFVLPEQREEMRRIASDLGLRREFDAALHAPRGARASRRRGS